MALSLPLELQQQVFNFLDPQSFYSSRKVCRWWQHASRDSVTLQHQLSRLPVVPPPSAATLGPKRLESIYNEAAHSLMLGMRTETERSRDPSLAQTINKAKVAISQDGRRAAALDSRQITHHDLTRPGYPVISTRPLNDLRLANGGGPWFKCAPTSVFELALSFDGNLLAVALERTIQIYDLSTEPNSWPLSSYVSSASGHYIAGLSFEHNDSLLRVQLSNKGTILYLGTPKETAADFEDWQNKGGLKHTFFDSAASTVMPVSEGRIRSLRGVQLLRPFENGWLFAAQQHGGNASSSYCLGYIASSITDGHYETAERTATVLLDLPSFLSAYPYTLNIEDLWSNLPSALEQYPSFCLSPDSALLALSEAGSRRPSQPTTTRAFVYRLPSERHLLTVLQERTIPEEKRQEKTEKDTCTIQRLPMSLGEVSGSMLKLAFEIDEKGEDGQVAYQVQAKTTEECKTWILQDS